MRRPLAVLLALVASAAAADDHFSISAAYAAPAKPKANPTVNVMFTPADPDVRINQEPGPRLKLDPGQTVLVDRQPPPARRSEAGGELKYLDPSLPVSFPVSLNPLAPKGQQQVKGNVTYFFCSKSEGWCRKGTSDISFVVPVP